MINYLSNSGYGLGEENRSCMEANTKSTSQLCIYPICCELLWFGTAQFFYHTLKGYFTIKEGVCVCVCLGGGGGGGGVTSARGTIIWNIGNIATFAMICTSAGQFFRGELYEYQSVLYTF